MQVLTLVTTLLDAGRYPKEVLVRLYEKRWAVEVNLRHLKQTLGMDILRCATWRGVWKELLVFVIVYNLVRRVMLEAARRQGVEPERISFADCAALAAGGAAWRGGAAAAGQPAAARPRGAACPQAAAEAVQPDEQAAGRVAGRVAS